MKGSFLPPSSPQTHVHFMYTQCSPGLQLQVITGQRKMGCGAVFISRLASDPLSGHSAQYSIFSCAGTAGDLEFCTESLLDHFGDACPGRLMLILLLPTPAFIKGLPNAMAKACV